MKLRFFILMINVNPGLSVADVQAALTDQVAWYRIANNVWIVHTVFPSSWFYQRLESLVKPSGIMFISALDPRDRQGWMPDEFWIWIKQRILAGG
jgi:hypothetical protein